MWKCHSLSFTSICRCRARNLKCKCMGIINVMFNPQNAFLFFMRACGCSVQVIWNHLSIYIHTLNLLDLYYAKSKGPDIFQKTAFMQNVSLSSQAAFFLSLTFLLLCFALGEKMEGSVFPFNQKVLLDTQIHCLI